MLVKRDLPKQNFPIKIKIQKQKNGQTKAPASKRSAGSLGVVFFSLLLARHDPGFGQAVFSIE